MKQKILTILAILVFLAGISLLAYPVVSNLLYEKEQEELMEHVWDASADSFSGAIRVHMSSLRRKLKAVLGYDPILNRVGEGYKIREEAEG